MNWRTGFLLLFLPCLASVPAWGQDKPVVLTFGYDNITFPSWNSPEQQGYVIQLLKLADDELSNVDFSIKGLPWKRCLEEMEAGTIDGCFSTTYSAERAAKGLYPRNAAGEVDNTRSLFKSSYSLMVPSVLKPVLKINGLNIEGWNMKYRIGFNLNWTIEKDLEPLGYSLEAAPNIEANKMKLLSGRIKGLADATTRLEILKKSGEMQGFDILTPPLIEKDFFLILGRLLEKKHPQLKEKIWNKISEVKNRKVVLEPTPTPKSSH
jgi:polar amino acid transport system substrate-binding protein